MDKYQISTKKGFPFEVVGNNYCVCKLPNKLLSYTKRPKNCPVCDSLLKDGYTLLPISMEKKIKIDGKRCLNCESIYIANEYAAELILRDDVYSKNFSLNGKPLWNISEFNKKKKKLQSVYSSEIMICIKYNTGETDEIIIVNNAGIADSQKNIFHYSSEAGKEFLSAAYAEKRHKHGIYHGKAYSVLRRPIYRTKKDKKLSENRISIEITIQADGGYSSSIKNKNYELVDLLLYSPYTNRYEIIKATHNKEEDISFVDISRYRKFVHEYGNPGIIPIFETNRSSSYEYGDLKDESILKGYGYNVNQKDNLPAAYRQELLSEIIDLNIMSVFQIVRFLDFLIRSRPHQRIAREKWMEDKKFVENYKVNPERFLIAKQNLYSPT